MVSACSSAVQKELKEEGLLIKPSTFEVGTLVSFDTTDTTIENPLLRQCALYFTLSCLFLS